MPLRWVAIGVFVLSSSLNYLDRQLLAALAPTLRAEFHLTNEDYGLLVSVFSLVYAGAAPAAGWLLDRVGLHVGTSAAVALWSAAGAATALTRGFAGLVVCRTVLGAAEAAGIPATGKAYGTYLEPREYALGAALNQVGITLGSVAAPLLVTVIQPLYGWRAAFALCGALGFLWIPLWRFTARRVPPRVAEEAPPVSTAGLLRDRRLWALAAANAFVMTLYALWSNWTTLYFVEERGLTQDAANARFAWIPPVAATAGGFAGAALSFALIRRGADVLRARLKVCRLAAAILLGTAAVPLMPTPALAAAAISLSFFWTLAISTNLYSMPIDLFGAGRAAFGVAVITSAYGLMLAVVSPWIGAMVDRAGFAPVCVAMAAMPLIGVAVLSFAARRP
jgi:ACS family hexuronate transporter-like MFS transporter